MKIPYSFERNGDHFVLRAPSGAVYDIGLGEVLKAIPSRSNAAESAKTLKPDATFLGVEDRSGFLFAFVKHINVPEPRCIKIPSLVYGYTLRQRPEAEKPAKEGREDKAGTYLQLYHLVEHLTVKLAEANAKLDSLIKNLGGL